MKLWRHEWALLGVQAFMLVVLVVRAGPTAPTLTLAAILALHLVTLRVLVPRSGRLHNILRLASAYPVALALYSAFPVVTPAAQFPLWDSSLLAADRAALGETPAVWLQAFTTPALTELMSACYLSYHLYLHGLLLLEILRHPLERSKHFADGLFVAFAVGYAGYFLFPAVGPLSLMASSFTVPLEGGPITALNAQLVARGGAVFDAFPSLHVLITFTLLRHDWRYARTRFLVMLPVVSGLVVSTLYLRYHYAVDLLAGAALFGALTWYHQRTK